MPSTEQILNQIEKTLTARLPPEQRLTMLLNQALDEALRVYTVRQFDSMMRDSTDQPARLLVGMKKAITAWRQCLKLVNDVGGNHGVGSDHSSS